MDKIKSFEIISRSNRMPMSFIPVSKKHRDGLYDDFNKDDIVLPLYDRFIRRNLKKRDMIVLEADYFIKFKYCDEIYKIILKRGYCFDGASVPKMLVHGGLVKVSSQVLVASAIHDFLFSTQPKDIGTYEDANNIFSAILREYGVKKATIGKYMMGVRSPIGKKIYRKTNPNESWMLDFTQILNN